MSSESSFEITVTYFSGGSITFNAEANDTIDCVKRKIKDKTGIPTDQQRLFFEHKQLEGGWLSTLLDLNIPKVCNLSLLVTKAFQLYVRKYPLTDFIILDVEASDTISDIKAKIQDKDGIPTEQQHLYRTDWHFRLGVPVLDIDQLKDKYTLSDYSVDSENYVIVILRHPHL